MAFDRCACLRRKQRCLPRHAPLKQSDTTGPAGPGMARAAYAPTPAVLGFHLGGSFSLNRIAASRSASGPC